MGSLRSVTGQALLLLVLALVAGTVSNLTASTERRLRWLASMPAPAASVPAAVATPGAVTPTLPADEIDTRAAVAAHAGGALFLDARRGDDFLAGRIPGARSVPVWEADVDDRVLGLMGEFPPDTHVVTYCTGGRCEDSHLLREKLLAAGFARVDVYHDGMPGWEQAGQRVER